MSGNLQSWSIFKIDKGVVISSHYDLRNVSNDRSMFTTLAVEQQAAVVAQW